MTKRAQDILNCTRYSPQNAPAIVALIEFAAQNPGLEFSNYGDRVAYAAESRQIGKDWQRFKLALLQASSLGVTDADVIEAAKGAYSGRLGWGEKQHTPASVECGEAVREGDWTYCIGQYFPTEYRKAAASVLEYAANAKRQAREPIVRSCFTIAQVAALNRDNGGHWFDKSAMRFFKTKIESGVLPGFLFVTSEQCGYGPRLFTVRQFDAAGNVSTVGKLQEWLSRRAALAAARGFVRAAGLGVQIKTEAA